MGIITKKTIINEESASTKSKEWVPVTIEITNWSSDTDKMIGQGLDVTKWKGCCCKLSCLHQIFSKPTVLICFNINSK